MSIAMKRKRISDQDRSKCDQNCTVILTLQYRAPQITKGARFARCTVLPLNGPTWPLKMTGEVLISRLCPFVWVPAEIASPCPSTSPRLSSLRALRLSLALFGLGRETAPRKVRLNVKHHFATEESEALHPARSSPPFTTSFHHVRPRLRPIGSVHSSTPPTANRLLFNMLPILRPVPHLLHRTMHLASSLARPASHEEGSFPPAASTAKARPDRTPRGRHPGIRGLRAHKPRKALVSARRSAG